VIRLGQPSTPQRDKLFCGRWRSAACRWCEPHSSGRREAAGRRARDRKHDRERKQWGMWVGTFWISFLLLRWISVSAALSGPNLLSGCYGVTGLRPQLGPLSTSGVFVTWTTSEPSGFAVYMSSCPLMNMQKTIRVPCGDHD
jgi:hypothetical protein